MMEETLVAKLGGTKEAFFELLWKRMNEKGDFPSLSSSVKDIVDAMQDEDHNASDLTAAVLSDFALTQKVIRLANSAMYAGIGGEITTITKASMVLGVEAIGHLALSVRFMDTISGAAPETPVARDEMARALLAGDIARKIAGKANLRDSEEVVVCALMHHLGKLLVAFYFPDEWVRISELAGGVSEAQNAATLKIIGITLDDIAQEAAKRWRLPTKIAHSMSQSISPSATAIPGSPEWLKMVSGFASEAAAISMGSMSDTSLSELATKYGDVLLVPAESIVDSVNDALDAAKKSALIEDRQQARSEGKPHNSSELLAAGVKDMREAVLGGISFGDALNMALETMYASMGFQRVVAYLRDGASFRARIGFGAKMPEALPELFFPEAYAPDVFHLSLTNSADVFIGNASDAKAAASLPGWFKSALPGVRAFVLLPMSFNSRPVGLLYGDWGNGSTGNVEQAELALLKALRDELMKVLKPGKK